MKDKGLVTFVSEHLESELFSLVSVIFNPLSTP